MSNLGYPTTSIGFLLAYYGGVDFQNPTETGFELVEKYYNRLFNFNFPFYVENEKIKIDFLKYFCYTYFNESIGFETPDAWRFAFKQKMLELMPYYSELYKTQLYEYEPLINRIFQSEDSENVTDINDRTESINSKNTGSNKIESSGNSKSDSQNITSDTPQVNFSGNDYASGLTRGQTENEVKSTDSASSENMTENTSESKNINDRNRKNTHTEKGFSGSYQDEIKKIRENILNINKSLCEECWDLFMLIY